MLKVLGIRAYPVLIYSGDASYVHEEWVSPQQFNHCIIAILVTNETQAATVLQHPGLGRLLIFDPTDENTLIGDLPDHEQGSLALVVAGDNGALMRMPNVPTDLSRLNREVEATLAPDGGMTATIRERSAGQTAVRFRHELKVLSAADYLKMVESWVTKGITGGSVAKAEPSDSKDEDRFELAVEVKTKNYAQLMRERLLIFKPAIVSRRNSLFLTEATRKHPVILKPAAFTETARFNLPDGFDVDELPTVLNLKTPFEAYSANCQVNDNHLLFTRSLTMRAATIPVEQYAMVRSFFEQIRTAEQAPVVLARK